MLFRRSVDSDAESRKLQEQLPEEKYFKLSELENINS